MRLKVHNSISSMVGDSWQPRINECRCIKNKHIYLIVLGGAGVAFDEPKKLQPNNKNNNNNNNM